MDFLYGVLGVVAYELVRARGRLIEDRPIVPDRRLIQYIYTVVFLAIVAGFIALGVSHDDVLKSLAIGFSSSAGFVGVFRNPPERQDYVEDLSDIKPAGTWTRIAAWINRFLNFN